MASLLETMQQNTQAQAGTGGPAKRLVRGPDGQLQEVTGQELQGLSAAAGIPAPPTTPAGVAGIGGSPDQAKMAGTPLQKGAALDIATGGQSQADYLRRQQAPTQQTAQQQKTAQKGQQLQDLSNAGDKALAMINSNLAAAPQQQAVQGRLDSSNPIAAGMSASTMQQFNNDLNSFTSSSATPEQKQQALADMGNISNHPITEQDIPGLLAPQDTAVAGSAAGATGQATVGALMKSGALQYNSAQLSDLLGVAPDKLENFSIQQLHDAVAAEQNKEFSSVQNLRATLQDPAAGPAEKAAAQQQLAAAGQSGVVAVDNDMSKLTDAMQKGTQITVGGKEMSVDDLMKSDVVSGIVKDAIDNPASMSALEKDESQLASFVKNHLAGLQAATAQMQGVAHTLKSLQDSNKSAYEGVSPALAAAEGFDPSKISATAVKPSAVVQLMKQDPGKMQAVNSYLSAAPPGDAAILSKLTPEQLKTLDIGGDSWKQLVQNQQQAAQIQKANPKDPAAVISAVSPGSNPADIQKTIDTNFRNAAITGQKYQPSLFDSDGDGKMDDPAVLQRNAAGKLGSSLQDLIAGHQLGQVDAPPTTATQADPRLADLQQKLSQAAGDGKIDSGDITNSGLSQDNLWTIVDNQFQGNYDSGAKDTVRNLITQNQNQKAQEVITTDTDPSKLPDDQVKMLKTELDNDPQGRNINRQSLLDKMSEIQAKEEQDRADAEARANAPKGQTVAEQIAPKLGWDKNKTVTENLAENQMKVNESVAKAQPTLAKYALKDLLKSKSKNVRL